MHVRPYRRANHLAVIKTPLTCDALCKAFASRRHWTARSSSELWAQEQWFIRASNAHRAPFLFITLMFIAYVLRSMSTSYPFALEGAYRICAAVYRSTSPILFFSYAHSSNSTKQMANANEFIRYMDHQYTHTSSSEQRHFVLSLWIFRQHCVHILKSVFVAILSY